jgi:EAL domain-containing protein (putative c-di-GMP-specific phosphodiesterase class I)/DNA-binding response OmpR family regulator
MMPENQPSASDALFYLGSDQALFEGLRGRLDPRGVEVRGFRTLAGMMLAAATRRARVLLLEPEILPPERPPEAILDRLAEIGGTRPYLVCLASAQESLERLQAQHPGASAIFQSPFDEARLAERVAELLRGELSTVHRVLVVDADLGEGVEIAAMLRRAGVLVELVVDVRQVRGALERFRPDLALLDLSLPRGGGRAVTETIRDHSSFRDLPIIFLSAEQSAGPGGEVLSLGGEDYLSRPIVPAQLLSTVERRIRRVRGDGEVTLCTVPAADADDRGALVLNRTHLLQRLDQTIVEHPIPTPGQALLFIRIDPDLPSLAPFGEAGLAAVRPAVLDLIRRLAGAAQRGACMNDEGFVLWAKCRDDQAVANLAGAIRAAAEDLEVPMGLSRARLTLSIGIGSFLPPADDALTLISRAQSACDQARDQGGNQVVLYRPAHLAGVADPGERALHAVLSRALEGHGFQLVYQPILSLRKRSQERYEVLLRLRTPKGDIIPPLTFLPVASRYGLLPSIDRWVLSGALAVLRNERDAGRPTQLMIFQSAASLAKPGWLHWVRDEILRLDLIRQRPILEFNAVDIVANEEHARLLFPELGRLGIEICLAGVTDSDSTLGLIARRPIGSVKLARELVIDPAGSRLKALVEALHQRGARVIAAGIEDPETIGRVWSRGVDYIQGNFIQFPEDSLNFHFQEVVA